MKPAYVDHIEVNVTNMGKAKEFFGEVFGWKDIMKDWDDTYVLVATSDPGWVSFGIQLVEKMPEGSTVAIMRVDNIEDSLKKVTKAGGKITREKFEVDPNIGFAGYFEDPFGNSWGFHSPPEK